MKCAAELMMIARNAEEARAIEKAKEEERKRQRDAIVAKQTINWCETILSKYLEKCAITDASFSKGNWSSEYGKGMHFDNFWGLNRLRPLLPYRAYANGKPSFTSSNNLDDELSFFVIQEYCKKHCVEAEFQKSNYMEYGFGCHSSVRLRFRLSPECFK
jgi:hypothetical protein